MRLIANVGWRAKSSAGGLLFALVMTGTLGAQEELARPIEYESTSMAEGDGTDCLLCDFEFDLSAWAFRDLSDESREVLNVDFGGWVQAGYTSRDTGLFNSDPDRFNFHQVWFFMEKAADGSNGLDWGFRADAMYGTDSADTQSFGNHPGRFDFDNGWDHGGGYGYALPQLYGEVAYGDLAVKVGHFYTLLGYEVVTAPDNFFFSHAFTMYNSEAFTHTGGLATYNLENSMELPVELYGGYTLGWDTGFDQFMGGNSFLGGASVSVTDDITTTYIVTAGDFGAIGSGYSHSVVFDYQITDQIKYVAQSDVLRASGGDRDTIGLNQYLLYSFNDCFGVGARAEWWKADGDSYYSVTGGVNYKPMANIIIRPELRYQWSPAAEGDANPEVPVEDDKLIFGIDGILTF